MGKPTKQQLAKVQQAIQKHVNGILEHLDKQNINYEQAWLALTLIKEKELKPKIKLHKRFSLDRAAKELVKMMKEE